MATIAQQPYVVARLVDASDSRTEMRVHIRSGSSRAAGVAAARQLADLVGAASAAVPIEHLVRYPHLVRGGPRAAPGSSRFAVGVLIFETDTLEQYAIIEIPGIKPSLIDPNNNTLLLLTAPPLANYITALTSGVFTNPFGYQLTTCIAGLYQVRQ